MAAQSRLPRPPPVRSEHLNDEEWISHYGREESGMAVFHDGPRAEKDEGELSAVRGKRDAQETAQIILHWRDPPFLDALVRHTQVGRLRDVGFRVEHTPNPRNPQHVSIFLPGKPHTWPGEAQSRLKACFEDEGGGHA